MTNPNNQLTHHPSKLVDSPSLLARRDQWRQQGRIVVWTNGCFDLLHAGHVRSLQAARAHGDLLVVGVNDDASVRRLKGPCRPILPVAERVELLTALECVEGVVIFSEDTPEAVLARLQPDVYCKGADYAPPHGKPIPELPIVHAYGGRVEFLPLLPERSTTDIIQRILASERLRSAHAAE